MQDEVVQAIAKAHNVTPAQVLISWQAARGVIVLPKSVTPDRIKSNFQGKAAPFALLILPAPSLASTRYTAQDCSLTVSPTLDLGFLSPQRSN